jgi:aspartyl-tRNA(Asn)/glutamyl-tRNA(Gln) amidotransferase subunit A
MRELLALTAHEVMEKIAAGEISAAELAETQQQFAAELDPQLNSFIAMNPAQPGELDLQAVADPAAVLNHVPVAVKDIFCTAGLQSTAGSRILKGYEPPYDATSVAALKGLSNYIVGKTNLDEFAMGSSGENSAYGNTANPWDITRVPGGSSSGSAAATAALQSYVALGTDTGGSVRQPASFCGVVGFRPSYGMVSRYGLIAYSSSCDQPGVFARDSLDIALTMNAISTPDPRDSTCRPDDRPDFAAECQREVHWEKLRVGVLRSFLKPDIVEPDVLANFNASEAALIAAGAQVEEVEFDLLDLCLPAYYIITAAECSSNLARFDGLRYGQASDAADLLSRYLAARSEGFGAEVKRRILLGTYVLSSGYYDAYYDRARQLRAEITRQVELLFERFDVLITPTSLSLPFRFGERTQDPVKMYLSDLCTAFVNLADTAGINLPNGFADHEGARLPTGLQFVCARFHDHLLLRVARQFELLTGWKYKAPQWVSDKLNGNG